MHLYPPPPWPAALDLDECLDYRSPDFNRRFGTRSRRRPQHWLCPDPTALPVQRFLARPPIPPPVPIPDDLPFDPVAYTTARRTLSLILEVLDRRRPLTHLHPVLTPHTVRYMRVVTERLPSTTRRGDARLLSIRMCQPSANVAEVAAVCKLGGRPRALAARFERQRRPLTVGLRWYCAVIQLG
jgi:hypothetical protein